MDQTPLVDPLESVKQAYVQRKAQRVQKFQKRSPILEHPLFSDHLDKLQPLSEERTSLPAASCRDLILRTVEDNRVVVICGATGCGEYCS